jgi:hypothetical protein
LYVTYSKRPLLLSLSERWRGLSNDLDMYMLSLVGEECGEEEGRI